MRIFHVFSLISVLLKQFPNQVETQRDFLGNVSQLFIHTVCGKPWERVSPILVTLTSRGDSNFERSNISLKENKPDGVDSNSNGFGYCVRKNEGKILWFSTDCIMEAP